MLGGDPAAHSHIIMGDTDAECSQASSTGVTMADLAEQIAALSTQLRILQLFWLKLQGGSLCSCFDLVL